MESNWTALVVTLIFEQRPRRTLSSPGLDDGALDGRLHEVATLRVRALGHGLALGVQRDAVEGLALQVAVRRSRVSLIPLFAARTSEKGEGTGGVAVEGLALAVAGDLDAGAEDELAVGFAEALDGVGQRGELLADGLGLQLALAVGTLLGQRVKLLV